MDAAPMTDRDPSTWTQEEIKRRSEARAEAERTKYAPDPEPEQADGGNGHDTDQAEDYPKHGFSNKFVMACLHGNEDGDARLYTELHRGRSVFDHAAGIWYRWSGHFWVEDFLNEVMAGVEKVISVYGLEAQRQAWQRLQAEKSGQTAKATSHEKTESGLIKRVRVLQTLNRKKNVLELARIGADGLGITGQEWDRDPWLLAVKNGVIDLRTGNHRPGRPDDFLKTVSPTEWKGLDEHAPTWEKFQIEIANGDRDLIDFKQRLYGYCTTGETTHHVAPILHGPGRNGKGTELETIKAVMGPYAGAIESELILKQKFAKHSGGPSSDVMNLRGKRIVWVSETDEGRRLNAGKVKWLSGGDTLTGRGVYEKRQIDFRPTHKLLILTNHRPRADAADYALWARLLLIPFKISFVDEPTAPNERKANPELPAKLKAEGPGILAWLVRGCLAWQKEGLNPPEAVRAATTDYREAEDTIGQFIQERCTTGQGLQVRAGELFSDYRTWAEEMGLKPMTGTKFGNEIKTRFDHYKTNYVFYLGLGLLDTKTL
jgi:putative DNA primase/helicase